MNKVILTQAGIQQAQKYKRTIPEYSEKSLRLYIEGKNCDGFSYGVTFDIQQPNDVIFNYEGINVIVDPESIVFLQGSTIDWVDDERGQGFDVSNPNQSKFRGKFFKRKAWQDYLEKRNSPIN